MTLSHLILATLFLTTMMATCIAAPGEYVQREGVDDSTELELRKYLSSKLATSQQFGCDSKFEVYLGGQRYEFEHCRNINWLGTMYCYHGNSLPPVCTGLTNIYKQCYNFEMYTTRTKYTFKLCNDYGSHCMTQWSPHITSSCDKLKQEMAQMEQDTVTLCEELPDGTRNCKSSDGQAIAVQENEEGGCLCVTPPGGKKVCQGECQDIQ